MAISSGWLLIVLIALPFLGSCLALLFRTSARTAEAYLAGFLDIMKRHGFVGAAGNAVQWRGEH